MIDLAEERPIGIPRIECTCIGDVEKADMLDAFHLAKKKHEDMISMHKDRFKASMQEQPTGYLLQPLIDGHNNAIKRIEVIEDAVRKIPTCPSD